LGWKRGQKQETATTAESAPKLFTEIRHTVFAALRQLRGGFFRNQGGTVERQASSLFIGMKLFYIQIYS